MNPQSPPRLFAQYQPRTTEDSPSHLPASLVIEASNPDDLQAIAQLTTERHGGDVNQYRSRLERQLADVNRCRFFVARLENAVVGFGRVAHFTPSSDAPRDTAPAGWYLTGIIVDPIYRRRGIGLALTMHRLQWLASRTDRAYYFANAENLATIDLHRRLGFVEVIRNFTFPGVVFSGAGMGILFCTVLPANATEPSTRT